AAGLAKHAAEERLEGVLAERGRAEEELADAAGAREQALQELYRLRSAAERVAMRRESAEARLRRLRDELEQPRRVLDERDRAELVARMPVVSKEELLSSTVAAVTPEGYGFDPANGELWFAGETAEALLLELQARRRELAAELDALRARTDAPIPESAYSL